jgi:hypothetical protein
MKRASLEKRKKKKKTKQKNKDKERDREKEQDNKENVGQHNSNLSAHCPGFVCLSSVGNCSQSTAATYRAFRPPHLSAGVSTSS